MYGGLHSPPSLLPTGALLELAREFTPRVEALGPTPVLLDLHGLGRVWPTPRTWPGARSAAAHARGWSSARGPGLTRVAALRGRPRPRRA